MRVYAFATIFYGNSFSPGAKSRLSFFAARARQVYSYCIGGFLFIQTHDTSLRHEDFQACGPVGDMIMCRLGQRVLLLIIWFCLFDEKACRGNKIRGREINYGILI